MLMRSRPSEPDLHIRGTSLSALRSIQGSDPPPFGVCLKSPQLLQAAWGVELFW